MVVKDEQNQWLVLRTLGPSRARCSAWHTCAWTAALCVSYIFIGYRRMRLEAMLIGNICCGRVRHRSKIDLVEGVMVPGPRCVAWRRRGGRCLAPDSRKVTACGATSTPPTAPLLVPVEAAAVPLLLLLRQSCRIFIRDFEVIIPSEMRRFRRHNVRPSVSDVRCSGPVLCVARRVSSEEWWKCHGTIIRLLCNTSVSFISKVFLCDYHLHLIKVSTSGEVSEEGIVNDWCVFVVTCAKRKCLVYNIY